MQPRRAFQGTETGLGLKRPFSAVALGSAVCKRFRSAREALRVGVLEGASRGGFVAASLAASASARAAVSSTAEAADSIAAADEDMNGVGHHRPGVARGDAPRRARSQPPAGPASKPWRRLLDEQKLENSRDVPGFAPCAFAAELRRALPPPSGEDQAPAPLRCGSQLLWHVPPASRQRLEAAWGLLGTPGVGRSRSDPLGYLEYQAWLQRLEPDSYAAVDSEAEDEALKGLSGLELFKKMFPSPKKEGVAPLSAEERQVAEEALHGPGRADEILASRFSVDLTRGQLQCLMPRTWLNDEVINFYCKLLQERSNASKSGPSCWFANSFFWNKLSGGPAKGNDEYNYKEVRRWTVKAKVDIFALDFVIFPMNIGESHWALGAIDMKAKGFRYFDSMTTRPHRNFVPFLRRYLGDEHKQRKGGPLEGLDDWSLLTIEPPPPQQNNCYDCGVFTCFFADRISAGRPLDFCQDDMPDLRLRVCARVVKADENWDDT